MSENPVAIDSIMIMLPPSRLAGWLTRVFAAKEVKGEVVPPEFIKWLERMERIRLGITTELSVLTDDEWRAINRYLNEVKE